MEEYIEEIVRNGDAKQMEELSHLLKSAIYDLKEHDYSCYKKYKNKLYEMAYGKLLNKEMAHDLVMNMKPLGEYWTMEQIESAIDTSKYRLIDFYTVANMLKNDYEGINGLDDEIVLKMASKWLNDEDAVEYKTYEYFTTIPKKD